MRKLVLLLIIISSTLSVSATETTKYLREIYSKHYDTKVKVVSKQEYIDPIDYKIDDMEVEGMVYGEGYMKLRKCKKVKISYIGLLDKNCKPIWAYIIKN